MSEQNRISLRCERVSGKSKTRMRVTLHQGDKLIDVQEIELTSLVTRNRFVKEACRKTGCDQDDLEQCLVEAASRASRDDNGAEYDIVQSPTDPHALADALLASHWHEPEGETLIFWRDQFLTWDGITWKSMSMPAVRAIVSGLLDAEFSRLFQERMRDRDGNRFSVTRNLVNDVTLALQSRIQIDDAVEAPAWIRDVPVDDLPDPSMLLACANGIIDFSGEEPVLMKSTPCLFTLNGVDYEFDPTMDCPRWLSFLEQLWPDDEESIQTLREIMGYCLVPLTNLQKVFLFIGPPRSGRGTIMHVLRKLIGEGNICGPTLGSLLSEFGKAPLLGKLVAAFNDARLSRGMNNLATIVETLLSISGEDYITINRKNLSQVNTKLTTRMIIVSNEIPELPDSAGALASRCLVLQFNRSWLGQEDVTLAAQLELERSGILNWASAGLRNVKQRGRFVQPMAASETVESLKRLMSPIDAFVSDLCHIGNDYDVAVDEFFEAWVAWCEANGRQPGVKEVFGKNLRAVIPHLSVQQRRTPLQPVLQTVTGGRDVTRVASDFRPRFYVGVKLAEGWRSRLPPSRYRQRRS